MLVPLLNNTQRQPEGRHTFTIVLCLVVFQNCVIVELECPFRKQFIKLITLFLHSHGPTVAVFISIR